MLLEKCSLLCEKGKYRYHKNRDKKGIVLNVVQQEISRKIIEHIKVCISNVGTFLLHESKENSLNHPTILF